jgi:adenylate kinase family enzyme
MRISIIGPSSGGKSTLAKKISSKFDVPHLQIDRLWFDAGGHEVFKSRVKDDQEKERVSQCVSKGVTSFLNTNDHWVSDGTYKKLQPEIAEKADRIIFINRPLYRKMWSNLVRTFTDHHRHPELSLWDEIKFTFHLYTRRNADELKNIQKLLEPYRNKVIELQTFEEIDKFYENL